MKTITDVQRMKTLYHLSGFYRHVAREMRGSRNTVRKHLRRIDEVRARNRSEVSLQYSNYLSLVLRINKHSLIKFENNFYSLPDDFPRKDISKCVLRQD